MIQQDFRIVTGPIRQGAIPVHIYNEGLVVFLYDEASEERIRDADPEIIWGASPEAFEDRATQELLASGELLIYGLHGDGGVDVEVVVGAPLLEKELSWGKWYPPETGYLSLPSGRLCVHSYNTLPMGDNDDDPPDEGAIVQVPPGTYRVILYRKDWDRMEEAGTVSFDEAQEAGIDVYGQGRVDEVILLTPAQKIPASTTNILFRDCLEADD
ncbi:MAG: hypothetical protein M1376_03675 [Planctomycetes bacterium]|nr:hypothetical protein [Planctomycetota bacterium]